LDAGRDKEALAAVTEASELWPGLPLAFSERVRFHIILGGVRSGRQPSGRSARQRPARNIARRRLLLSAVTKGRRRSWTRRSSTIFAFSDDGVYPGMVGVVALATL
jgi:hypothetical protein